MSSYIGRHAELYDIFYADKAYKKEAAIINRCFQIFINKTPLNILELACGTGNHAFELVKEGHNMIATDYSNSMLTIAKKKLSNKKLSLTFKKMDMMKFSDFKIPFDAVICLFDSIGYVKTNSNINKVFMNVRDNLNDDGLFIFEFWHSKAMLKNYDPVRVKRFKTEKADILRISETKVNKSNNTCRVKYSIYEHYKNGKYNYLEETQINRFFEIQEMKKLLKQANLIPVKYIGDFNFDKKINSDTWHIICIAKKVKPLQ